MKSLIVLAAMLLTACKTPMIEYTNPDYNYLAETPVPMAELTGFWVGMSSNTQENFKINADGTGLICSEYGVNSSAAAIKVVKKNGQVLLMNPAWYYTLTNGNQPNEKLLSSSLSQHTRNFTIHRVPESDLSLNCKLQFKKH